MTYKILDTNGVVFDTPNTKVVQRILKKGDLIASHTHVGNNVVLSVLQGSVKITIADETNLISAGTIINYEGELAISGEIIEDAIVEIVLIKR